MHNKLPTDKNWQKYYRLSINRYLTTQIYLNYICFDKKLSNNNNTIFEPRFSYHNYPSTIINLLLQVDCYLFVIVIGLI